MGNKLLGNLDGVALKLRPYILFTSMNTILRGLNRRTRSILDVGCGKGEPMRFINKTKRFYVVGVDIFEPYLKESKRGKIYDDYVLGDVRSLPFRLKSFDTCLCLQVLEHLEKKEAKKFLKSIEKISRHQVIISVPNDVCKQQPYDGNPWQAHKSTWTPAEMKRLGYTVRGHGLPIPLSNKIQAIIGPLAYLQIIIGPLVYLFPRLAGNMVCWKRCSSE
ncbi:MAG: hypothetical protein DDT30_00570 [Dehalococcoidia bacterium]|nr:hypothetical protein [Bacillota bacterium]MBT9142020.1 hypothetical protein [Bacillota bacterium]